MSRAQKYLAIGSFIGAVLALILGTFGFNQLRKAAPKTISVSPAQENAVDLDMFHAPPGEELNQALRLFTGNADYRLKKDGLSISLYLATFLAYASILSGGGLAIYLVIRQSWRELRLQKFPCIGTAPSVVVFNLPDNLRGLIPDLKSRHKRCFGGWTTTPVVIVMPDRTSPLAKACERDGLWVVEASPFDSDYLQRSAIGKAPLILIFGEGSYANLDLALRCQDFRNSSSFKSEIYVAIEEPDIRYALQPQVIGRKNANAVILPFSLCINAARQLLSGGRLARLPQLSNSPDGSLTESRQLHPDATYLLFGCGRWLRAFFTEIIKTSVISVGQKPTLHIFCPDADALDKRLHVEIPEWEKLHADIHFHHVTDMEPEGQIVAAIPIIRSFVPSGIPWNFLCLLPEDGDNLSLATRLSAEIAAPTTCPLMRQVSRILFLARDTEQINEIALSVPGGPWVEAFDSLNKCGSLRTVLQTDLLDLAAAIHRGYSEIALAMPELKDRTQSLQSFQKLSLIKREQNFAQASHIDVKLACLGLENATAEEIRVFINGQLPSGWFVHPNLHQERTPEDQPPDVEATLPVDKIEEENILNGESQSVTEDDCFDLYRQGDSKFGQDIITFAELEHLRWIQVHALAGFRHNKIRNDFLRHHDCLIPFSHPDFPKKTIPYDVEAIRILPLLVSLLRATKN